MIFFYIKYNFCVEALPLGKIIRAYRIKYCRKKKIRDFFFWKKIHFDLQYLQKVFLCTLCSDIFQLAKLCEQTIRKCSSFISEIRYTFIILPRCTKTIYFIQKLKKKTIYYIDYLHKKQTFFSFLKIIVWSGSKLKLAV